MRSSESPRTMFWLEMKPETDAGSRKLTLLVEFESAACVSTGTSGRVGAGTGAGTGAGVERFETLCPLVLVHLFLMFADADRGGLDLFFELRVSGAMLKEL